MVSTGNHGTSRRRTAAGGSVVVVAVLALLAVVMMAGATGCAAAEPVAPAITDEQPAEGGGGAGEQPAEQPEDEDAEVPYGEEPPAPVREPEEVPPVQERPAPVQEPAAPDEDARIAAARRAALREGVIAYRPPSPMRQGDVQRVVVRAAGVAERGDLLAGFPGGPASVTERAIPVGLTLHAELVGDGFEVRSLDGRGNPFRPTLPGDVAEWQWDIEPTESGTKTLTLLVRSYYGDLSSPVAVRYVDEPVEVDHDLAYSLGALLSSPGWAATGITVPVVAGLVVALARRRRRTEQEAAATRGEQPVEADGRTGSPSSPHGYL